MARLPSLENPRGGWFPGRAARASALNHQPGTYAFKTEPYPYQGQAFLRYRDGRLDARPYVAEPLPVIPLFMEPRTGKSKIIVDIAAYQYELFLASGGWDRFGLPPTDASHPEAGIAGITGLVVAALPGRVHANWVKEEVPIHLPDRIPRLAVAWDARGIDWDTKKRRFVGRLWPQLEALLKFRGLSILAVNGEAVITDAFRRYVLKFMKARRRVFVVGDEFTLIMKSHDAKRTKVMHRISERPEAVLRAILDGTPAGESPFDLWAPFAFLDWRILGHRDFYSYKQHFAFFEKKTDWTRGHEYEQIVKADDGTAAYMHLDELQERLAKVAFRVKRADAPPKMYASFPFQLSDKQREVYDALRDEYEAQLHDLTNVTAKHVLTRYLRLQQVSSNFWPSEKVGTVHEACEGNGCAECDDLGVIISSTQLKRIDPKTNPRMDALEEVLLNNKDVPTIVWARFHEDVDGVIRLAERLKLSPVRYDGRCTPEEKDQAKADFQAGRAGLISGNTTSGGRGLSFMVKRLGRLPKVLMVYYTNQFGLLARLQSEERAEAVGKEEPTDVVDIIAEDTIDDLVILPSFRAKKTIADFVLKERGGKWL